MKMSDDEWEDVEGGTARKFPHGDQRGTEGSQRGMQRGHTYLKHQRSH